VNDYQVQIPKEPAVTKQM